MESMPGGNNKANKENFTNARTNHAAKESSSEEAGSTDDINEKSNSGENDLSNREQNHLPQKQNLIDLADEDFDSSDDEAVIYRMKLKQARIKIEQDELSRVNETTSEGDTLSNTTVVSAIQSDRIALENSPTSDKYRKVPLRSGRQEEQSNSKPYGNDNDCEAAKLKSKRGARKTGLFNSDSNHCDSDPSPDSHHAATEGMGEKERKRYPNGYDSGSNSDEDSDDNTSSAQEGQTNVTNW
eukprot:CAMPEP_0197196622 /NCGR_PEP_ID=MMETSP1423-20130617/32454_1 /TAXON_ID=476441 /ORGANISM="Pseudo-nitzschia heimii, Strain UNC1101" /LENGTH=240 /DNA_ID=CAMNT_0042650431 /DNA_START=801 /DNA_END=1520 /DNA_ORIENTATION=+